MSDATPNHPLWEAIGPLLTVVGGEVVPAERAEPGDVPISWDGDVIGAVRLRAFTDGLERLIAHIEAELGAPLADLSRTGKQDAIRMLDEQGAFLLRRSVDDVADRMGVSRITIYNYLAQVRGE